MFDTQLPEHVGAVGNGWRGILLRLHEQIVAIDPGYSVVQVKEKFGGLRVYLRYVPGMDDNTGREQIRDAVWAAEEESYRTCEDCGKPGVKRESRRWIRTLCDTCAGEGIDILKEASDAHR